jgi:hypothetical protein
MSRVHSTQIPVILCAVCNKPVDSIEIMKDVYTQSIVYSVSCHGEKDQCSIPQDMLEENLSVMSRGVAFQTKKLEHKPQIENSNDSIKTT